MGVIKPKMENFLRYYCPYNRLPTNQTLTILGVINILQTVKPQSTTLRPYGKTGLRGMKTNGRLCTN